MQTQEADHRRAWGTKAKNSGFVLEREGNNIIDYNCF